jgi:hypothetical protein
VYAGGFELVRYFLRFDSSTGRFPFFGSAEDFLRGLLFDALCNAESTKSEQVRFPLARDIAHGFVSTPLK